MPSQRLSQAKLQKCHRELQALIAAIHDARVRHVSCTNMRPGRLSGLSRYLKDLLALPADSDFSLFEVQLKRRLVRVQHRVFGRTEGSAGTFSLIEQLPAPYEYFADQFDLAASALLRCLGDVDIRTNHQRQVPVAETLALRG